LSRKLSFGIPNARADIDARAFDAFQDTPIYLQAIHISTLGRPSANRSTRDSKAPTVNTLKAHFMIFSDAWRWACDDGRK